VLEIVGLAALFGVLVFAALFIGLVVTILKLVAWVVLLPLRLVGKLLWLPVLAIGATVAGVTLGALLLLPVLPFLLVAALAWMVIKRSRRARPA